MKYLFMMIFGLMMLASCAKEDVQPVTPEVTLEQSNADCECELGLSERPGP